MTEVETQGGLVSRIRLPETLTLRDVWPSEPRDFTPWLASNLGVLDFLGLGPLSLVGVEVSIPDTERALDLLAETATGERVAIENQYGRADHDHLTRGLAYAVGLNADALVVIAEEHRGEFRAVASYLNRVAEQATEGGIHLYLVELTAEAVGEYVVPRLSAVAEPNRWLEGASRAQPKGEKLTLAELLAALPPGASAEAKEVIEWWTAQPGGSIRFSPTSASLDRPHPGRPGPLSHLLIYARGDCTVQRGYLREAGIVTEETLKEFDALIRVLFPDASWVGKAYFLNLPGVPDLASVKEFFCWTDTHS